MIGYILLKQFEWTKLASTIIDTALTDISSRIHVIIDIKSRKLVIQQSSEETLSNKFRYELELEESDLRESYYFQIKACALKNNLNGLDNKKLIKIFIHHDHFEFTIHDKLFNIPPNEVDDEDKDIAHVTLIERADTFDIANLSNSHAFEISSEMLVSKLKLIRDLKSSENINSENEQKLRQLHLICQVSEKGILTLFARKERWFAKLTCDIDIKADLATKAIGIAPPSISKLIKVIEKVKGKLKITLVDNSMSLSQKHWHFTLPTSEPKWDYNEELSLLSVQKLSRLDLRQKARLYDHTAREKLNKAAVAQKARVYLKNDTSTDVNKNGTTKNERAAYTLKLNLDQDGSGTWRNVELTVPLFEDGHIISLSLWCLSKTLDFLQSVSWQYDKLSSALVITDHQEKDHVVLFAE
ncbi:hypothetical protein K5B43_000646 [Vibrio parahaemolyticus]|nr:hypothetical protein [Vibrio parahaemolyticus]